MYSQVLDSDYNERTTNSAFYFFTIKNDSL